MSSIENLIEAVREDGATSREILSMKFDEGFFILENVLLDIKNTLLDTQRAFSEYFNAEGIRFKEQQEDLRLARLAEIERLREMAGTGAGIGPQGVGGVEKDPNKTEDKGGGGLKFGFLATATAVVAAVSGYLFGLIKTLGQGFKDLGSRLVTGFKNLSAKIIPDSLKSMGTSVMESIRGIGAGLSMQFDMLKASITDNKVFQSISSTFSTIVTKITDFFKPLAEIPKIFSLGGEGGIVSKFIDGVTDVVKSIGGYFGKIFTGISKLAAPITAIIGIFNTGSSTLEEVNEETSLLGSVLIGLKNLVKEMVSAFVTVPIELVKDIISWVAGAFGFESVEKALDSFDIDAMFREGFSFIIDIVSDLFNFIGDKIYELRKNLPGFLGGIDEDNIDPEAEMRIAQREVTSASQDVADIPINEQNMDNPEYVEAMERYNEAVAKRDKIQQQFGTADVQEVGDQGGQDQQQAVIKELANKMSDAGVRTFSTDELKEGGKPLDAKLKGGVPVEIDGTPVPRELYTAEQLQKVEQAEAVSAAMAGGQPQSKSGMVIPSATDNAQLSESGQAAVDNLRGSGVPDVNPETGKRGMVIGDSRSGVPDVNPETGKRGMVIGDSPMAGGQVTPTPEGGTPSGRPEGGVEASRGLQTGLGEGGQVIPTEEEKVQQMIERGEQARARLKEAFAVSKNVFAKESYISDPSKLSLGSVGENVSSQMQSLPLDNMDFAVPVNKLLNTNVAAASKEISSAKSAAPIIIAPNKGGDSVTYNNMNQTTTVVASSASARSNHAPYLRHQDRMQGTG